MKSACLPTKGLLCLYDKQNNTWLLVDMEFLFSGSTRHFTRSLRSLVSNRFKHSKRNSISTRAHVSFFIYSVACGMFQAINVHGDYNFFPNSARIKVTQYNKMWLLGNRPRDKFPLQSLLLNQQTCGVTSYHVMDPFAHIFSSILCIALSLFTRKIIVARRFKNT